MVEQRKKIILVANTSWFIYNFQKTFITELLSRGFNILVVAPYDATSDKFEKLGVKYVKIKINRKGLNPFSDINLILRLKKIYQIEKPDYIFHSTIKPVIFGSIAARFANAKCIVNMIPGLGYVFIGQSFIHKLLRPLVNKMYKFALQNSKKVFFQNPNDMIYFTENSLVQKEKVVITYGLGVDLKHFYFVGPSTDNTQSIFLYIGRILWDKGIGEFVEAAKKIKEQYSHVRFQLLGKTDYDNPSHVKRATLDEWIKNGYIEYLGETTDVRPFIEKAVAVVLPSYREGIPNSLLEAMSMGKPIITTDVPGCRETIKDGINGLLIPPRDIESLAYAMQTLISNPKLRIEMGKESRMFAEERFDVNKVNSLLLETMGITDF